MIDLHVNLHIPAPIFR